MRCDRGHTLIKAILSSDSPVVVYTYPKGAQAASAGRYIMISSHIAVMAPGTEIGAMHPVSPFLNFGKRDDHLAVGKGSINFAELVLVLKEIGYDDTLTIEVFDPDRQMLVESRRLIKAMFAEK